MQSKSSFYSPLSFPEWMSWEVTYLYSASPLYSEYTDIPLNHYKVPLSYFFPIYEMFIAQFYLHVLNPYLAMFTQFDALVDLNPIACTRKVSLTFYILTNIDSFVKNGTAYKIDLKPFFPVCHPATFVKKLRKSLTKCPSRSQYIQTRDRVFIVLQEEVIRSRIRFHVFYTCHAEEQFSIKIALIIFHIKKDRIFHDEISSCCVPNTVHYVQSFTDFYKSLKFMFPVKGVHSPSK